MRLHKLAFRATIDKLKADNQQLKEDLQLERKHAKVYDSVSAQAQIAKLQDAGDMYTRKIELEKRRIEARRLPRADNPVARVLLLLPRQAAHLLGAALLRS